MGRVYQILVGGYVGFEWKDLSRLVMSDFGRQDIYWIWRGGLCWVLPGEYVGFEWVGYIGSWWDTLGFGRWSS